MTEVAERSLEECWQQFLEYIQERCSATAFENWLSPIQVLGVENDELVLEIPNVFVREYLIDNYSKDLLLFFNRRPSGEPALQFRVAKPKVKTAVLGEPAHSAERAVSQDEVLYELRLNPSYLFNSFIEGPANQFVKSAALGVATHPGKTYNPLFIHGGVGLGKTHLLHAIGHHVRNHQRKLRVQCITTEAFINDLVDSLRNKSVDKLKRYYRNLDLLLVDDIQFLQNRLNFEEEFCNTFETLINQNKQIVITSDKPPSQLKLSERMVARMEWGLVANVGVPDLETRVAILQAKAEAKGLQLPSQVAFFIAEHIYNNVRQLEGAVNRLTAHARLLKLEITQEFAEKTLREMLQQLPPQRVTIDAILKSVAAVFQVKISDLKGALRTKEVALPRQVAMFLAKELVNESLVMLAASFGKTHSTVLHACKAIEKRSAGDELLRRQIDMVRRNIEAGSA